MTDVRATTELVETLSAIARWYPATANPPRVIESQTKIAYGPKMPTSAEVLSLRRQTVDTLAKLAVAVASGRGLVATMPCPRPAQKPVYGPEPRTGWPWVCGCTRNAGEPLLAGRRHPLTTSVDGLVSFLAAHVDWIATQQPRAAATLTTLATRLEEVVKQTHPAKVKIDDCPEDDCTGKLQAIVRRGDTVLPSVVRCSKDRDHSWAPHEWSALGRRTLRLRPADPDASRRLLMAIFGQTPQRDVDRPRAYGIAAALHVDATEPADHSLDGLIGDPANPAPLDA